MTKISQTEAQAAEARAVAGAAAASPAPTDAAPPQDYPVPQPPAGSGRIVEPYMVDAITQAHADGVTDQAELHRLQQEALDAANAAAAARAAAKPE